MDVLCIALEHFSKVEEVTEPTLCALRHCTARHPLASQAQSDVRLSQTLPVILELISSMRAPVVKAALGLVRNLALLPANLRPLTHVRFSFITTFSHFVLFDCMREMVGQITF